MSLINEIFPPIFLFYVSVENLLRTWPYEIFIYLSIYLFFNLCPLRHLLHHCFQALMDHGVKVASILANSFSRRCSYIAESDAHVKEKAIQFGFVLGQQMCCVFFVFFSFFIVDDSLKVVVMLLFSCQVAFCQMPVGMGTPRKSLSHVSSCACYTMRYCTGIVHWSAVSGGNKTFFLIQF